MLQHEPHVFIGQDDVFEASAPEEGFGFRHRQKGADALEKNPVSQVPDARGQKEREQGGCRALRMTEHHASKTAEE